MLQIHKGIRPAAIGAGNHNPFFTYAIVNIAGIVNRLPSSTFFTFLFSLQLQVNTRRKLFQIRNLSTICRYPFFGYSYVTGRFVIVLKFYNRIFRCFCCNGSVYGSLLYIKGCIIDKGCSIVTDQNLLQGRAICRFYFCNLIICSDRNTRNRIGFSLL